MTRQYQNNYLLSRISGLAFDLMIVAGIASIELRELTGSGALILCHPWAAPSPGFIWFGYASMSIRATFMKASCPCTE